MAKKDKPTPSFIGEKEIKEIERDGSEMVSVIFKDKTEPLLIDDSLLKLIIRPIKNEGTVTDVVTHCLASRFIAELAGYGLEFYMIESITQGMRTYGHNLRESAIGKAFDCNGGIDMTLDKLID